MITRRSLLSKIFGIAPLTILLSKNLSSDICRIITEYKSCDDYVAYTIPFKGKIPNHIIYGDWYKIDFSNCRK